MKYKKTFYCICTATILATLAMLAALILCIVKVITFTSGQIFVLVFVFAGMAVASFACTSILMILYDDWKWRNVDKHGKWKR